jgi:hypothetical protein
MSLKTSKQYSLNLRDGIQSAIVAGATTVVSVVPSIVPAIYHWFHQSSWTDFEVFRQIDLSLAGKLFLYSALGDLGRRFLSRSKIIWTKVDKDTVEAVQDGQVKPQIVKASGKVSAIQQTSLILNYKTRNMGIENLEKALDLGLDLGQQISIAGADGFSWTDTLGLLPSLLKVPEVVNSRKAIGEEIADLDDTERESLYQRAKARFDIEDDKLEQTIEAAIGLGLAAAVLANNVRPKKEPATVSDNQ